MVHNSHIDVMWCWISQSTFALIANRREFYMEFIDPDRIRVLFVVSGPHRSKNTIRIQSSFLANPAPRSFPCVFMLMPMHCKITKCTMNTSIDMLRNLVALLRSFIHSFIETDKTIADCKRWSRPLFFSTTHTPMLLILYLYDDVSSRWCRVVIINWENNATNYELTAIWHRAGNRLWPNDLCGSNAVLICQAATIRCCFSYVVCVMRVYDTLLLSLHVACAIILSRLSINISLVAKYRHKNIYALSSVVALLEIFQSSEQRLEERNRNYIRCGHHRHDPWIITNKLFL